MSVRRELLHDLSPLGWDRRLVAPGPAWRLRALHLTLLVVIGLRLGTHPWWQAADRVPEMFEPVAVLRWLDAPPSRAVVVGAWILGLAAVVAGLVQVRRGAARGPLVVAWSCLLFLAGLWGSGGKVLHNDVLMLSVTVPVLLAPSPRRRATAGAPDEDLLERDSTSWGWAPRAALVVLGVVYAATGVQKLRHSGVDWVLSENLRWVLRQGSPVVSTDLVRSLADQLWLTQALAAGALVLELTAPALLAVRRARIAFAAAVTVMHTSIWLAVGIDYWTWSATAWAVVLPSTATGARLARVLDLRRGDEPRRAPDREVVPA